MQKAECSIEVHSNQVITPKVINGKEKRLWRMMSMMILIFVGMLSEMVVGIIGNSLTLLSDSFHMLSDAISMLIGYYTIKVG